MATRPIICPPQPIDGFLFRKDKFVLEEDYNITNFFDFSDLQDEVISYSRLKVTLKRNKSVKISQTET